jgi:hypothetical protein
VWGDGDDGELSGFGTIAPEHAIGAWSAILDVGLEDLLLWMKGVREGVVFVRVEPWVAGVFGEQ